MRTLTLTLALFAALITSPPAHATSTIQTRTVLAAAQQQGIIGFGVTRYENGPHGYHLASGYVRLEAKPAGADHWKAIPGSRRLAYKGRARLFYAAPTKPGLIRAVSLAAPGYHVSYSRPLHMPL